MDDGTEPPNTRVLSVTCSHVQRVCLTGTAYVVPARASSKMSTLVLDGSYHALTWSY